MDLHLFYYTDLVFSHVFSKNLPTKYGASKLRNSNEMKLRDAIIAGIAHLTQNRLRAGLSILGIFIGIASVLCMMAIGDGAKKIISDGIETLGGIDQVQLRNNYGVYRRGRWHPITERLKLDDALAIEAEVPNIRFVLPKNERYRILITAQDGKQARPILEGVTADYARGMHWSVQEGRFISESDVTQALQVCILGNNVATELFGETSPIGKEVKIKFYYWRRASIRARVVGVMAVKGRGVDFTWTLDDVVCVPLTTHQQRISGYDYIERITIFTEKDVDKSAIIDSARAVIRKRHRNRDDFVRHWVPTGGVKRLEHIQRVIKIALGSIAGFSLFVSGIGIMNICLVSVGEKTREIGLRKSVGAKRIHIFWQFLTESICLCFCGGVLGIAGGWVAGHGMARLAVRIVPIVPEWPVVLSWQWILTAVVFSLIMGISFGVYPAMQAARLSPIDALRTED